MPYDPEQHGPRRIVGEGFHNRVYEVVRRIPCGSIATYGDVAGALGLRSVARQVGFALAALPDHLDDVPWHRVVNARGELSHRGDSGPYENQRQLLLQEGIEINERGRILMFEELRFVLDPS